MGLGILQVNTYDVCGGAEKIAGTLHSAYRERGHDAWLAVKQRRGLIPDVVELDEYRYASLYGKTWRRIASILAPFRGRIRGANRLRGWLELLGQSGSLVDYWMGREVFNYPASRHILEHMPMDPDIVHCHNLHGGYFDLRYLPDLTSAKPVVLTLHDEWLFTGHCACSMCCEEWSRGCGKCNDLNIPCSIRRDSAARNLRVKQSIYRDCRLWVATPSSWLARRVERSVLSPAIRELRVINNGIDLSVFCPGPKETAREVLGISSDALVVLFVAQEARSNPFKDFGTLHSAVQALSKSVWDRPLVLIALGSKASSEQLGNARVYYVPFNSDPDVVANYYRAADVYAHAAKSDNFPTTVIEALACGIPVVATAVGGICEQIEDRKTGFLTRPGDVGSMVEALNVLLRDSVMRSAMSAAASECALCRFDQNRMVDEYISLYEDMLQVFQAENRQN